MKRLFIFTAALAFTDAVHAQKPSAQEDSLRVYDLQQIEVTATRATKKTPIAFTDLSHEQLARDNFGQDIPSLLQFEPSVVATSEAGTGIGGTALRIRGSDATRINVTMNGVPMNDAETHSIYWYDTPDLASSVGSLQIQRGAGTSTNGTGAFGGSINMASQSLPTQFGGSAALSYGSYNTNKQSVQLSSGLLGGHWALDAHLSHIGSDGYVERASTDMKSYLFQAGYYSGRTMVKLLSFGGKARVGLAYTGLTKDQMAENRRYNPEGEMYGYLHDAAGSHLLDEWGSPMRGVVGFYDQHKDNFLQLNNQLIVNHRFNERWALNVTGHYTYGDGYYQNYKNDQKLKKYDMKPIQVGDVEVSKTNLVRRKNVGSHFGGIVGSANYTSQRVSLSLGGAWNTYEGDHWGQVLEMELVPGFLPADYYRNATTKRDANLFAKVNWEAARGLHLFADLQYRHIGHRISGVNDNYDDMTGALQSLDIHRRYDFFNPKAGVRYTFAQRHSVYASFSVAQKEPTRNNFTDTKQGDYPTAERLSDWEFGYQYSGKRFSTEVNFYYMTYKDQLILTGEVSDTGEALARNIPDSYRRGVELSASWEATKWLTIGANATLSQNRIRNYEEHIAVYDNTSDWNWLREQVSQLGTTNIAYSPSVIAGTWFRFHAAGFEGLLRTQYVSKQYLTNAENENMTLDRYCVTNLNLSYTIRSRQSKTVRLGVMINNLFNTKYCNNGYGYSSLFEQGGRVDETFYFPQATLNALANVTVMF